MARLALVRDSKVVPSGERERLFDVIHETAVACAVGAVGPEAVDRMGIGEATRAAMAIAVEGLHPAPDALLIDYLTLPAVPLRQQAIVDGDALSFSIAAASIVAKVTRDRLMARLDGAFPGYGFARHKGYGTREHWHALVALGPSPIHRQSWRPVQAAANGEREYGRWRERGKP
jgi:ribonuclease HII